MKSGPAATHGFEELSRGRPRGRCALYLGGGRAHRPEKPVRAIFHHSYLTLVLEHQREDFSEHERMKMLNRYVIVRTYKAGCHAGTLVRREGAEVELDNARRLYYWAGAASLSELAQRGPSLPDKCLFPVPVDKVILLDAEEILSVTETAKKNIESVPLWTAWTPEMYDSVSDL